MFVQNHRRDLSTKYSNDTYHNRTSDSQQAPSLKRSEVISDIFNNPTEDKDKDGDAKVRLSHTSRRLTEDLKNALNKFLSKNKPIAKVLHELPLPDNEYLSAKSNSDLTLRKAYAYRQWLLIHESSEKDPNVEPHEQEAPYLAIHTQDKDEEIKNLLASHEEKYAHIKNQRSKNIPNYYYEFFPETYSFN